jgi:N-acetylmuramoyl-L-alanine amidase
VAVLVVLATLGAAARPGVAAPAAAGIGRPAPHSPGGPETVPVVRIDGEPHLPANECARLLDAAKFWRADVRKLVLRTGRHRVVLTVDNPFVLVDDRTIRLPSAVRSVRGELQIPVALLDSLPRDTSLARLLYDPRGGRVVVLPPGGVLGAPRLTVSEGGTRVTFPADRPEDVSVVGRARARFRVRFGGFFTGSLPDTLPRGSLVRAIRTLASATGSAFELEVSPEAAGYRLIREGSGPRVTIEFSRRATNGTEEFAPEGAAGTRALRVVVLDPGHGGEDAGVTAGGAVEKDLTLALARVLKGDLERRLPVRVVLTRTGDVAVSAGQRAEIANRVRADLVVSLHFDGFPGPGATGATAYCPPATFGAGPEGERVGGLAPVAVLPWRDVATRYAVSSRALAEAVLGRLALRDLGPTRLRELLPYDLLGANAPGILLECATLTAPSDRARLMREGGLESLASSIADGIAAYRRNE